MIDPAASDSGDAEALDSTRALPLLVVAAGQGLALYGLHKAIDLRVWPAIDTRALLLLYCLAVFVPVALLLSPREWPNAAWRLGVATITTIVFGCGWYVFPMGDSMASAAPVVPFLFGFALFWFIALPFSQAAARLPVLRPAAQSQQAGRNPTSRSALFDYPTLFALGWQNCLRLVEAAVFTGLLWALLFLGAGLFKVINIDWVLKLIEKPIFAYPVSAICFGFALYLLHSRDNIVRTLRRHLLAVFQWLLPLAVALAAGFLIALMFTGMQPLWSTRHSASLVGALLIFLIVLYNAAYGDGVEAPAHPRWLATALRWGVLTLPPLAAIGLYALALRIGENGLSVDRILALAAHGVLAVYALGYAAAALPRGRWLAAIGTINICVALIELTLIALLASPILDPMRLTVDSQLARLDAGKISADKFDYDYFRFHLGERGVDALRSLAGDTHRPPKVRTLAQLALAKKNRWSAIDYSIDALAEDRLTIYPSGKKLDPGFLAYAKDPAGLKRHLPLPECLQSAAGCTLVLADLDNDGRDEVIFIQKWRAPVYSRSAAPALGKPADEAARGQAWRLAGALRFDREEDFQHFDRSAAGNSISAQASPWDNLLVGALLLRFEPASP